MNFKYMISFCLLAIAISSAAEAAPLYANKFAIGYSAPTAGANVLLTENGFQMVRASGGATVSIRFLNANLDQSSQVIGGLKITAYSKSGRGHVFIHGASISPDDKQTELRKLEGMLAANKSVKVTFAKPISAEELDVTLEGFGDDDASVVIEAELTRDGNFKYKADEDLVNPPESYDGDDDSGSSAGSYRDQCFGSPGHFGCDDRGPNSIYNQSGCEATPGSFNCQGG